MRLKLNLHNCLSWNIAIALCLVMTLILISFTQIGLSFTVLKHFSITNTEYKKKENLA